MSVTNEKEWDQASNVIALTPVALLIPHDGQHGGKRFTITTSEVLLGRIRECDVVVPSRLVSRYHAKIFQEDGFYVISDLDSLNGTFVNGIKITGPRKLAHGDVIRLATGSGPGLRFDLRFMEADGKKPADKFDESRIMQRSVMEPHIPQPTAAISLSRSDHETPRVDAAAKLSAVLRIVDALGNSLDLHDVLERIIDCLFRVFPQAKSGYVLIHDPAADALVLMVTRHRSKELSTLAPLSKSLAKQAFDERTAFLCSDSAQDDAPHDVVTDVHVRSFMCAPLAGPSQQPVGAIQIDTVGRERQFTHRDLDVLASVAVLAGQAVENSRMHEARLQLARRERDMALAREVQLQFLPQQSPNVPGYEFHEYYAGAEEVAGDFFDYIPLPDGRVALVIGDVCGKGVSAALLMARITRDVRMCLSPGRSPAEAVGQLNRMLMKTCDRFVTLLVCILDHRANKLTLVNAGHPAPLLRRTRSGDVVPIGPDIAGLPLGVDAKQHYQQHDVRIEPGELVLCYTDGVSEAMNPAGDLYGADAITALVARNPSPLEAIHAIIADVGRFSHNSRNDDVCLLAFGRT